MQSDENKLLLWVAYVLNKDGNRNYLSDQKGHLRIFKSEEKVIEYLTPLLSSDDLKKVVIHSIQGQIAVPEPKPLQKVLPITSMSPLTTPTAMELLNNIKKRRIRGK